MRWAGSSRGVTPGRSSCGMPQTYAVCRWRRGSGMVVFVGATAAPLQPLAVALRGRGLVVRAWPVGREGCDAGVGAQLTQVETRTGGVDNRVAAQGTTGGGCCCALVGHAGSQGLTIRARWDGGGTQPAGVVQRPGRSSCGMPQTYAVCRWRRGSGMVVFVTATAAPLRPLVVLLIPRPWATPFGRGGRRGCRGLLPSVADSWRYSA